MLVDLLSQRNLGQQVQDENNQQGQRHSRRSGPHDDNTDYERTIQFRPEELGFFDPQLPISYGGGDIVVLGRDTYYRNVHVFISRIKDLVAAKGRKTIQSQLSTCLRGAALAWYTTELSDFHRNALRSMEDGIDQFCDLLLQRFKGTQTRAIEHLTQEKYTYEDARNNRDIAGYVQTIIRHAKDVDFTSEYNQLNFVWTNLDPRLRFNLPQPMKTSTILEYITILQERQESWFDMLRPPNRLDQQGRQSNGTTPSRNYRQYSQYSYRPNQQRQEYVALPRNPPLPMTSQYLAERPYSTKANQLPPVDLQRQPQLRQHTPNEGSGTYKYTSLGQQQTQGSRLPYYSRNQPQSQPQRDAFPPPYRRSPNTTKGVPPYTPKPGAYHGEEDMGRPSENQHPIENPSENYQDDGNVFHMSNAGYAEMPATYWPIAKENWPESYDTHYSTTPVEYESEPVLPFDEEGPAAHHGTATAHAAIVSKWYPCNRCQIGFPSNNKLHQHIRSRTCARLQRKTQRVISENTSEEPPIIESTAANSDKPGFNFRSWHYATIQASLTKKGASHDLCINSGCTLSLIDKNFLLNQAPNAEIRPMASPLTVKGIGNRKHAAEEYAVIDLYVPGNLNGKTAVAHIKREVHIVPELKAKLLIGMDILGPERMDLSFRNKVLTIHSCRGLSTKIQITPRTKSVANRTVRCAEGTILPANCVSIVPVIIHSELPEDRDYLFEPEQVGLSLGKHGGIYTHIVDHTIHHVHVFNDSPRKLEVPKNRKVGHLTDYDGEGVFHVDHANHPLAVKPPQDSSGPDQTLSPMEYSTENGITIYGDKKTREAILSVVNEFPHLWIDKGETVHVPDTEFMKIPLKDGWQNEKLCYKVYPLSEKDRTIVDEEFDKLHEQGKMEWTTQPTPFGYPVFVVWQTIPGINGAPDTKKGRVVVDIRGLNKIVEPDPYPMPLQSDIISYARGCPFISTIDSTGFFHQWMVMPQDREKLTVISHRGQESFNVAVMGLCISPAYVQRKMDRKLRPYRAFA